MLIHSTDDFDDFVSAPLSPAAAMGPTPHAPAVQAQQQGAQKMNLMQMLSQPSVPTPVPAAPAANLFGGPTPTPSYGGMSMMSPMAPAAPSMGGVRTPMSGGAPLGGAAVRPAPAPAAKSSGGGFEDLWTMSLGSAKPSTPVGGTGAGHAGSAEGEDAGGTVWQWDGCASKFGIVRRDGRLWECSCEAEWGCAVIIGCGRPVALKLSTEHHMNWREEVGC
jgi:epsin